MKDDADPRLGRGGEHHRVEGVVERRRIAMMDVVELADRRDAGPAHLAEGEEREGVELRGVQPSDQRVHRLAPGPEAAGAGGEGLAQAAQAALEGVRVGRHQAGEEGAAGEPLIRRPAEGADLRDPAILADGDLDSGFETAAGPGEVGFDRLHDPSSQKWRTALATSPRAAANSSFGRYSFGLWATSIEPGPKMAQSSPSCCSQPASVA